MLHDEQNSGDDVYLQLYLKSVREGTKCSQFSFFCFFIFLKDFVLREDFRIQDAAFLF
jgi:hypothetical protein